MVDFNDLKEKVKQQLEDIVKYDNKEEDLFCLEIQIIGLRDTFKLISREQTEELKKMVQQVKDEYKIL